MAYSLFIRFIISQLPAIAAVLLFIFKMPRFNPPHAVKLLLWIIIITLLPLLFIFKHEPGFKRAQSRKLNWLLNGAGLMYGITTLATLIYQLSFNTFNILESAFWIIPLQLIFIGLVWPQIRHTTNTDEQEEPPEIIDEMPPVIPSGIFEDRNTFKQYCNELLSHGKIPEVLKLLADPQIKFGEPPVAENDIILAKQRWNTNEKAYGKRLITREAYLTEKNGIVDSITNLLNTNE